MKVFLDASVLVRLSPKSEVTGALMALPLLGAPVELVSSAYALQEALATMADPHWPPKASIAAICAMGQLFAVAGMRVRLEQPSPAAVAALKGRCGDEDDLPILADALAEGCDVVLTDDNELLRSTAGILCQKPQVWLGSASTDPDVAAAVERALRPLRPLLPPSAAPPQT